MRTSSHMYTKRCWCNTGTFTVYSSNIFYDYYWFNSPWAVRRTYWYILYRLKELRYIKEVFCDFPNVISQMHQWALWNITYTAPILDIVSNEKKLIKPGEAVRHELWVLFFSFFNWTLRVQNAGTSLFRSRSLSLLMRLFIKIVSVRCGCVQHWGKCLYRYTLRGVRWNCTHFGLLNLTRIKLKIIVTSVLFTGVWYMCHIWLKYNTYYSSELKLIIYY